jgi:uncharacterized protein (DUF1800 family)
MLTQKAAIAANRFGLGACPRDGASIGSDASGWLEQQLNDERRATSASPQQPPESARVLQELRDLRVARQIAARARANAAPRQSAASPGGQSTSSSSGEPASQAPGIDREAIRELGQFQREHYVAQVGDRHRRAIGTDRPFVERLVHFWSNHFAVSADKMLISSIVGLYEQEAIRPRVTGNFYDLLLAAEQHPAMNLYLDNTTSMGAESTAARFARNRGRELGLNENLAREILELHTLGVDGGYGQHDVTEFAKVITGWSIGGEIGPGAGGPRPNAAPNGANGSGQNAPPGSPRAAFGNQGEPGQFHFRPLMHEPGDKTVLGKRFKEQGVEEGEQVLTMLAKHPATAKHLATKLARHFVADDPPPALVARLAEVYLDSDGELLPVYRALLAANESWREPRAKYKTPQDFVISTFRALEYVPEDMQPIAILTELGQRPFTPGSPAGWPDVAASWDGSDALLKRIEWAAAVGKRAAASGARFDAPELAGNVLGPLNEATLASIRGAADRGQSLALLLAAPEFQRR